MMKLTDSLGEKMSCLKEDINVYTYELFQFSKTTIHGTCSECTSKFACVYNCVASLQNSDKIEATCLHKAFGRHTQIGIVALKKYVAEWPFCKRTNYCIEAALDQ